MSDVTIFIFGVVVSIVAVTGFWLFLYGHYFRPNFVEQNTGKDAVATGRQFERVPSSD